MITNNNKVQLKDVVAKQLPEFVRENYPTFVAFVEAYYEFLEKNSVDVKRAKDIDLTVDDFVQYFKKELAHNYPADVANPRFFMKHIRDQYTAKGSEASYRLLFRLLYGKEIYMDYPGKQMLRVSDGRWKQDVSVFVRVDTGDPYSIVGKAVDVQTSKRVYRTEVNPLTQKLTKISANVESVALFDKANNIWELFLDRNFYGTISSGDIIKYGSSFQSLVLPTTSRLKIQNAGEGFKPGMIFQVSSGNGTPIWFKVTSVNDNGGLVNIDIIKFGLNYDTDFSITILPTSAISSTKKIERQVSTITYSKTNGVIGDINILTGGNNYLVPPDVVISGNGSGATAHAVVTGGVVTDIIIDNHGTGYTSSFVTINAQAGDTGSGATAEVILGDDYSYTTVDKSKGFNEAGYINYGDYWDVYEHGTGARASATVSGGQVTALTLTAGGSGYDLASPEIDICIPLTTDGVPVDGGRPAKATATVVDGVITALTITDGGSGYIDGLTPAVIIRGSAGYSDGAYVGSIVRQFYLDAKDAISGNQALINVSLDALAKYPGYYKTNDGFLNDAMFIQDSNYYQAFSYVVRIDEQLASYASAVRSMLHPAGMALFGEYSIDNQFDLSIALEVMIKSLGVTLYDFFSTNDEYKTFSIIKSLSDTVNEIGGDSAVDAIQYINVEKALADSLSGSDAMTRTTTKGLTETIVESEVWTHSFDKSLGDIVVESEVWTHSFTKSLSDSAVGSETFAQQVDKYVTDTTVGTFTQSGYIVLNPYEEGGYFLELYANAYASTF